MSGENSNMFLQYVDSLSSSVFCLVVLLLTVIHLLYASENVFNVKIETLITEERLENQTKWDDNSADNS